MDWKRKLSSRKFWVALGGFVTALIAAWNAGTDAVKITAVIMAFGTLVSYVLAEGFVDAAAKSTDTESADSGSETKTTETAGTAAA